MAKIISNVYGEALFSYALEENEKMPHALEKMYEEAIDIKQVFSISEDLKTFIFNPRFSIDEKKQFIKKVFVENIWKDDFKTTLSYFKFDDIVKGENSKMLEVVDMLIDKNRAKDIPNIIDYFINKILEYKNILKASITSAKELTDEQKKLLKDKLVEVVHCSDLIIDYKIDNSFIEGMRIKIGDKVFDNTYKNKIHNITKNLRGLKI